MDLLFVLLTLVFFGASWGLLRLCEQLLRGES
jgi:hypothetical protein